MSARFSRVNPSLAIMLAGLLLHCERVSLCRVDYDEQRTVNKTGNARRNMSKWIDQSSTSILNYYPTSLCRVQITPKTSTNITRYLYSRGPVRQVFSQRASDEFDSSYEKNFFLSIGISFLRFFLTEILK